MKTRLPLSPLVFIRRTLLLLACACALSPGHAVVIPTYQWTDALGTYNWEDSGNWLDNVAPTNQATAGNVIFGPVSNPFVSITNSVNVRSLTFSANSNSFAYAVYPVYSTDNPPPTVGIGPGGITVGDTGDGTVYLSLPNINLLANQTWNTTGNLTLYGSVSSSTAALTKTGAGALTLYGRSAFSGGLTVSAGTLYLGSSSVDSDSIPTTNSLSAVSGPVGLGLLTLQNNTTLAATDSSGFTLANNIALGGNLHIATPQTLYSGGPSYVALTLGGTVTAASTATVVQIDPINRVEFAGTITGPANTSLTFTGGGTAVLSGTTSPNIQRLVADYAAIFLETPGSLPASSLQVFNGGYLGLGVGFDGSPNHGSAADAIRFITDPAHFNGTLGFDTETGTETPNTFHGNIDLTAFTNAGFTGLGTGTFATIASDAVITPIPNVGYKFGGGGGRLVVATDLNSATNLIVSSPSAQPTTIVLQGPSNAITTAQVSNSLLILDYESALDSHAKVQLNSGGYLGATENWYGPYDTPSGLFSLLDAANLSVNGIVGFDSSAPASNPRFINDNLDLTSLSSAATLPYLGTTTFGFGDGYAGLVINGTISVPENQPLKLAGINGGILTVNSPLTFDNGITSLVVGYNDGVTHLGDQGTVILTGANTYAGGTTLQAGTLILQTPPGAQPVNQGGGASAGPLPAPSALGTGDLTIAAGTPNPQLIPYGDVELPNNIINNVNASTPLVVGQAYNGGSFTFDGVISGPGALLLQGASTLNGVNTYSGGTTITNNPVTVNNPSGLGTGPVTVTSGGSLLLNTSVNIGSLSPGDSSGEYDGGASIYLANEATLNINQTAEGKFGGTITGDTDNDILVVKHGDAVLGLNGTNTYTGGTIVSGGILITSNDQGFGTGPVTLNSGTAVGIDYNTTITNNLVLNGTATLAGYGTYAPANGALTIAAGGTLSPGAKIDPDRGSGTSGGNTNPKGPPSAALPTSNSDNSPPVGTLTFGTVNSPLALTLGSGGAYSFGLQDSLTGGLANDLVVVNGAVTVTATSSTPFNFTLASFDAAGAAGTLQNFNNQQSYTWTVLTANSITGFDPSVFSLSDQSAFANALAGGTFNLSLTNDANSSSLLLNFSPAAVPEPSTYALLALGLGLIIWFRRRK